MLAMVMRAAMMHGRSGAADILHVLDRTTEANARRAGARTMMDELAGLFRYENLRALFLENVVAKL